MLWITVDRKSDMPLTRQVYDRIRMLILSGELRIGEKLPSTRGLAAGLKISRNVVLEAYDQLIAEGYIESKPGSGIYVSKDAQLDVIIPYKSSKYAAGTDDGPDKKDVIDFRSGVPALEMLPIAKWTKLFCSVCNESGPSVFGYGRSEGCRELRSVLSGYLLKSRGVKCIPEQIIVTTGAVQALALAARLLTEIGDKVLIEDPSNFDLQAILSSQGAVLCPVPVDEAGMKTNMISEAKNPKLVYVTPSHQFSLRGILPIQRRIELIRFAREKGCFINDKVILGYGNLREEMIEEGISRLGGALKLR